MFTPEEVRILGLCAPQVMKLLEAREALVLNKIYGEWRTGKLEHTAALAEFTTVRSLIHEIKSVLAQHNKQEEKRHESATTD